MSNGGLSEKQLAEMRSDIEEDRAMLRATREMMEAGLGGSIDFAKRLEVDRTTALLDEVERLQLEIGMVRADVPRLLATVAALKAELATKEAALERTKRVIRWFMGGSEGRTRTRQQWLDHWREEAVRNNRNAESLTAALAALEPSDLGVD